MDATPNAMTDYHTFNSDGVEIAFRDEAAGSAKVPALFIHGFASNLATNWAATGWLDAAVKAGRRAIAYDNRGHGRSAKLYELTDYGAPLMAEDARRLLDHLKIARTHVVGYSMGARIAAFLALAHPTASKASSSVASGSTWCAAWREPARSRTRWKPHRSTR